MVNEELEAQIRAKYLEGVKLSDIKISLGEKGWTESEIDAAVAHIHRDAIKQLPLISHTYDLLEKLEIKTSTSYKMVAAVFAGCALVVLLLFVALFMWLDPLGTRGSERDKQRETDVIKLRMAIDKYQKATGAYPEKLDILLPKYIATLPLDPETGAPYKYTPYDGGGNYELCVTFETVPVQCISPKRIESEIPYVVTQEEEEPIDSSSPSGIITE